MTGADDSMRLMAGSPGILFCRMSSMVLMIAMSFSSTSRGTLSSYSAFGMRSAEISSHISRTLLVSGLPNLDMSRSVLETKTSQCVASIIRSSCSHPCSYMDVLMNVGSILDMYSRASAAPGMTSRVSAYAFPRR